MNRNAALMWLHAVVLVVVCPVWAGLNINALVGPVEGWAAFGVFAVAGSVLVWRHRNNWEVRAQ